MCLQISAKGVIAVGVSLHFLPKKQPSDSVFFFGMSNQIHCKAGLGRTGCLIAAWLVYKHSFTANEAIGFMRICRVSLVDRW